LTQTRTIREALQALIERHGSELPPSVQASCADLMNQIKQWDNSEFSKVLAMLMAGSGKIAPASAVNAHEIAESLRTKLLDNAAFSLALEDVANSRATTKAVLADVFKLLYRRSRGVRTTMSRDELLRLIQSERDILLRHGTLEALTLPAVKVAE
jgi:hypothetical protein